MKIKKNLIKIDDFKFNLNLQIKIGLKNNN